MSKTRQIQVQLEVGDTILVGKNREPATITKIEYHDKSGEICLNTTKGPRKMLTFAIQPEPEPVGAEKYR